MTDIPPGIIADDGSLICTSCHLDPCACGVPAAYAKAMNEQLKAARLQRDKAIEDRHVAEQTVPERGSLINGYERLARRALDSEAKCERMRSYLDELATCLHCGRSTARCSEGCEFQHDDSDGFEHLEDVRDFLADVDEMPGGSL